MGFNNQNIRVTQGQTAPSDVSITFTDVTTNNSSINKHGFLPKLPNDAAQFLDGTGSWVASGSDYVLMDSGNGSTSSASDVVIGTKTFTASDFSANDMLEACVITESSAGFSRCKIKITDGGTSATLDANTGDPAVQTAFFKVSQSLLATTKLIGSSWGGNSTNIPKSALFTLTSTNWITTAFTIDVLGSDGGASTSYYKYWIYKRKS